MSNVFAFFEWGYAGHGLRSMWELNSVHQVLRSTQKLFSLSGHMDGFVFIFYWCSLNGGWAIGSKRHWSSPAQAFVSAHWCRQSTDVTCTRASTSVEVEAAHRYDTCRNCQGFHFSEIPRHFISTFICIRDTIAGKCIFVHLLGQLLLQFPKVLCYLCVANWFISGVAILFADARARHLQRAGAWRPAHQWLHVHCMKFYPQHLRPGITLTCKELLLLLEATKTCLGFCWAQYAFGHWAQSFKLFRLSHHEIWRFPQEGCLSVAYISNPEIMPYWQGIVRGKLDQQRRCFEVGPGVIIHVSWYLWQVTISTSRYLNSCIPSTDLF